MTSKAIDSKMKYLIFFLILLVITFFSYRTKMAERDFAKVLLEKTEAKLASESGINILAEKINFAIKNGLSVKLVIDKTLNDGWLQAGTEKEARYRISYAKKQKNKNANSGVEEYDILCEGKSGARVYSTAAIIEINNKSCSIKSTRMKSEN